MLMTELTYIHSISHKLRNFKKKKTKKLLPLFSNRNKKPSKRNRKKKKQSDLPKKEKTKKIIFDGERMKYPHTGLYHFCLQLGSAIQNNKGDEEELTFYVRENWNSDELGLLGENYQLIVTYKNFENIFESCISFLLLLIWRLLGHVVE
mgnify:CR=1 FL=1